MHLHKAQSFSTLRRWALHLGHRGARQRCASSSQKGAALSLGLTSPLCLLRLLQAQC